jgi:hypothetical protein
VHPNAAGMTPAAVAGRAPVIAVLAVFAGICGVLTLVVGTGATIAGPSMPYLDGPVWLDGWFQGDSVWYLHIAENGYSYHPGEQSSIAFFPSYPMAARALGSLLGGQFQVAGSLLGVACGAAAVSLFVVWAWRRLPRRSALTAIAVMMLYPYSFFLYGAMYSDSLFLLAALGGFMLLERRLYWWAGLAGIVATAGRPVGLAVAVGLTIRMLEMLAERRIEARGDQPADGSVPRPRWRDMLAAVRDVRWPQAGVLISILGLLGWCGYLWVQFGDPLAWLAVQEAPGWSQGSGPKTLFKIGYLDTMRNGPFGVAFRLTAQALMCLIAILLMRRVFRLFGWGYLAYAAVVLAIPLIGTKDFMGTGRYVLAAFPVIAAAGHLLANLPNRWARPVVLALLGAGLIAATATFSMSIAVS